MSVTITEAMPELKAIAAELGLEVKNFKVIQEEYLRRHKSK